MNIQSEPFMHSASHPMESLDLDAFDPALEKSAISDLDVAFKRSLKLWSVVKKSRQDWDFKTSMQVLDGLAEALETLGDRWQENSSLIRQGLEADQAWVQSAAYPAAIETALQAAGIPYKGAFPNYDFPPFKLTFNLDQGTVRLSMGRKSQQTKVFSPEPVAQWVSSQYRKVIDSKFDATRFCRELLSAYEVLNRMDMHQEEVAWGHSIGLKDIYRLLTLKQTTKQDYPEPLFTFDLARLKEQPEIRYEQYQFELQPSRNLPGFVLINSQGQESRVSTLAIHRVES
jgi:hypothetical protein